MAKKTSAAVRLGLASDAAQVAEILNSGGRVIGDPISRFRAVFKQSKKNVTEWFALSCNQSGKPTAVVFYSPFRTIHNCVKAVKISAVGLDARLGLEESRRSTTGLVQFVFDNCTLRNRGWVIFDVPLGVYSSMGHELESRGWLEVGGTAKDAVRFVKFAEIRTEGDNDG